MTGVKETKKIVLETQKDIQIFVNKFSKETFGTQPQIE